MKKFFKWVMIVIVAIVVINIATGGEEEAAPTKSEPAAATTEKAAEPKKEEPKPADTITKENYDKVKAGDALTGDGGMTIEEVTALLGEKMDKTESQTGDMKMEIITWNNGKLTEMKSISVTFINGKASGKNWLE